MGIFDNDLILPGTITEIESDYSFGYDTSLFGTTDSVLVIGTAFNGPVGKATPIYSPEHAKYVFGNIYDYSTKREATLVAEILNIWDRGCRTIYATRISGRDINKDFQLISTNDLKLRVSGIFPSNQNKDVSFVFDDTYGESNITVYKPANRATIQEKMQGLVDGEDSVISIKLDISNSYGLTREDSLSELIRLFNDHQYNNVLRLSVVDRDGNDVTYSSKEAQSLSIGDIFPGAYFIGRDENKCYANTDMQFIVADDTNKPYSTFDKLVFKRLISNSDVRADLPIYAQDLAILNQSFSEAQVVMRTPFDFLEQKSVVDNIYGKDSVDYEEAELDEFEVYKRLGSGFATTAKAVFRNSAQTDIKVVETPATDENKVVPIQDGVYPMLENLDARYRILSVGNADATIRGAMPKKHEFKVAAPNVKRIFEDRVEITPVVEESDLSIPKAFSISLDFMDPDADISAGVNATTLYGEKTIEQVAFTTDLTASQLEKSELYTKAGVQEKIELEEGTVFANVDTLGVAKLYRISGGKVTILEKTDLLGKLISIDGIAYKGVLDGIDKVKFEKYDLAEIGVKKYVIVKSGANINIAEVDATSVPGEAALLPIGGIDDVFSDEDDKTLIYIEDVVTLADTVKNSVIIRSSTLDYTSLEEFFMAMNEHEALSELFEFKLTNAGVPVKDEYIILDPAGVGADKSLVFTAFPATADVVDKTITYSTTKYIPFKTTDNFARQLAQHCTYTSLKEAPTHGIIGCSPLIDTGLTSIAKKVEDMTKLDFNLYAKKPNGKDMLDANNLPYPIGRDVSVVVGQYVVSTGDGYNYISNGSGGYAGMVSVLPIDQSSTNQPINIPTPSYEFSNHQLGILSRRGFITFKQSYTKGTVVTDGVTMAPATSAYRRLSVTRIIGEVGKLIRASAEPFIGKQNSLVNRNSLETAIRSNLEKIKGTLIEDYSFKLLYDPAQARLGILDIDYGIVPIYEIVQVRNKISIKEQL